MKINKNERKKQRDDQGQNGGVGEKRVSCKHVKF